jgi:hypothetical protein
VTLVEETTEAAPSGEPQALFPEARRRRRRIRLVAGLVLIVTAIAIGGLVYSMGGGTAPPKITLPKPISSAPSEITPPIIIRATEAAATAQESWQSIDGAPGCNPTVTGNGVINLVHPSSAVTVTESGCLPGGRVGANQYRVVQIGGSVFQTRQPHEAGDFPHGKTWIKIQTSAGDLTHLGGDEPLLVLNAARGPLQRAGTVSIRGVVTTEYRGTTTLQALQTATHVVNYGPFGTPDPPLNQIPVHITVWIDASNRLRQLSTWQPQYVLYFTDGSSEGGTYLVQPTTMSVNGEPVGAPKGPPHKKGYEANTLDLWRFGAPARISPPPAKDVTEPKH